MWRDTSIPCPVCKGVTEDNSYSSEGVLYESEKRCKSCNLWHSTFSYGHSGERIGYVYFEESWNEERAEGYYSSRKTALEEIHKVIHSEEFKGLLLAPIQILAEWLDEKGCPMQAEHCRRFGNYT